VGNTGIIELTAVGAECKVLVVEMTVSKLQISLVIAVKTDC
jgi:hypothetical protein